MHRQKTKLAAHVPRGKRLARAVERYGYATTYVLHDRVLSNRRRQASKPPAPDELQRSIVAELDANGYAVVPLAELVADDALVQEVDSQGDAEEIKSFTARRGTLILCNMSGLHHGGFAIGKPPVLATATYCSPASLAALPIRNFEVAGPHSQRPRVTRSRDPTTRAGVP